VTRKPSPDVQAWLAARQPAAPQRIAAHVAAAADLKGDLPEQLALAGVALLNHVVAHPDGGRELALDLLAADALVTYAFEAQAEADVDGLIALADRLERTGDIA
jgi:hypothetical protein